MCRPMEPNPNSKIFMCPTVVNTLAEMLLDGGLGHTSERVVNQSVSKFAGFVHDHARFGAVCCVSSQFLGRRYGLKKSCCCIHPVVIFALYSFLTVICGRPHQGEHEPYCTNRMAHGNLSSS